MSDDVDQRPIDILLVDDNEDDIVLMQESFQESKLINVLCIVRDGVEALAYLRHEGPYAHSSRPGLVLLDINMPKKNGFEVLQAMKADPHLRAIPVIMLTTSQRDEDIVNSYTNGACSYLAKPVNFAKLKDVVQQFSLYWSIVALPQQPRSQ